MGLFKEISGATLNYGIGKFVPQIIGFLLIPVYTRYMTPEDYGLVELVGAFAAFAIIFMRLALPGSVSRFYYEHKEGPELRNYITTLYWALMGISIGMAIIIFLVSYLILDDLMPDLPLWPFVVITLFTGVLNTNAEIQKRLIQARKQSRYSAMLSIITSLVGIGIAVLLVVGFKMGAEGILYASLASGLVFFIQSQVYLHKDMGGTFSWALLIPSFKYSANIVPSHLVTPFGKLFSRTILANQASGLAQVGLYSLANRFITPLTMLADAFNTSYIPIYFELRKKHDEASYKRLIEACKKIWVVSLLIFLGVATAAPPLIYLVTPQDYHIASELIPYLSFNFLLGMLTVMYGPEIYYSKQTHWVTVMAVVRLVASLAISYFLIDYFGVYAIVIAMFMENVINLFFSVFVSRRMFNFDPDVKMIIKTGLLVVAFAAVQVFFVQKIVINNYYQLLLSIVFEVAFIALLISLKIVNFKTLKSYLTRK